jgi:predicted nucleic acid-binding protein
MTLVRNRANELLLDTNICSAHLKRPSGLVHYFVQHSGRLFIPTVVLGELYAWAYRRPLQHSLLNRIEIQLLPDVELLDFDQTCAHTSLARSVVDYFRKGEL